MTAAPSKLDSSPSSRKRLRVDKEKTGDATDEEVIPSSQSDERELSIPNNKPRKSLEEVKESVCAWREASASQEQQQETNIFAVMDENGWMADNDEGDTTFGMNIDFAWDQSGSTALVGRLTTPTPIAASTENQLDVVSPYFNARPVPGSTPRLSQRKACSPTKNTQLRTPECSSPVHELKPLTIPTATKPDLKIVPPTSSRSTSPRLGSSSATSTKVAPLTPCTPHSHKQAATPKRTPQSLCKNMDQGAEVAIETPNTKTARLIAKIKADAFAAAATMSSDDEKKGVPIMIDSESELSELSSDAGDLHLILAKKRSPEKRKTRATMRAACTSDDDNASILGNSDHPRPPRRSARFCSPGASSSTSVNTSTRTARGLSHFSTGHSSIPAKPRKSLSSNPVAKLLKEKMKEEKYAPLRQSFLDIKLSSDDDEDEFGVAGPSKSRSASPTKGMSFVRAGSVSTSQSQSTDLLDLNQMVGDADGKRFLELDEAEAEQLDRILERDRAEKGKMKAACVEKGIIFWSEAEDGMDVDGGDGIDMPILEGAEEDGLMSFVVERVKAKG